VRSPKESHNAFCKNQKYEFNDNLKQPHTGIPLPSQCRIVTSDVSDADIQLRRRLSIQIVSIVSPTAMSAKIHHKLRTTKCA